jgi:hypothetical protein
MTKLSLNSLMLVELTSKNLINGTELTAESLLQERKANNIKTGIKLYFFMLS